MKSITQWRISALVITIVLAFLYFYSKSKYVDDNYVTCRNFFKVQYMGVIDEIDERGRTSPLYRLRNNNWFWPYLHRDTVEIILQKGDSVNKPSNSFDLYIYKSANPDSVIYLPCDFDCKSLVEKD